MIVEELKKITGKVLNNLGVETPEVVFEHPAELAYGDYSTNVALRYAKELKKKPRELAEEIVGKLEARSAKLEKIEKIEVGGAGFINFYLSKEFFSESIRKIQTEGESFGKNKTLDGKKVMVEYTDPNPFKEFHIGHLMSNAIGESIARITEFQGAEVKRACYQGDVGLHVAKAVWGVSQTNNQQPTTDNGKSIRMWGESYARGSERYEIDEEVKKEIDELNKKIFDKSNEEVNTLYESGRRVSLEYFEEIYKKLGTKFAYYFFESETGAFGKQVVEEFLDKGVFEKSQGAIIFPGEKHGLHTRVFINSQGLPTYEAKELGLAKIKYDKYNYDQSVVITGNEINDYFRVLLCALNLVFPELAKKTKHLSHGMLRLPTGKMSSRTGCVITGEAIISAVEAMVHKKIEDREMEIFEKNKVAEAVAVGAIKYSILRQAIGGDIIFDFDKSISFEGDSGPYLQYSLVRAKSVLNKVKEAHIEPFVGVKLLQIPTILERLLYRFPEIVARASAEYEPHYITTYLTQLAGAFNSWYAKNQIIGSGEAEPYRLALTSSFATVMKNGLYLLGIPVPSTM